MEQPSFRKPQHDELRLLIHLGSHMAIEARFGDDWFDRLMVMSMDDGGMGSLKLHLTGHTRGDKSAPCTRPFVVFKDVDEMEVWATMHFDENGLPYELDMWKVDFSPLQRIPEVLPAVQVE